jgi:hypothetical protein
MAALVAAIHALRRDEKDVDARDKPAHDGVNVIGKCTRMHESSALPSFRKNSRKLPVMAFPACF